MTDENEQVDPVHASCRSGATPVHVEDVRFTAHAQDRYIERVRPGLTRGQANEQLERLRPCMQLKTEPPEWAFSAVEASNEAWLWLGDDVAFPVESGWALTCLTKGTIPKKTRARRNSGKSALRKARKVKHGRTQYEFNKKRKGDHDWREDQEDAA